MPSQVKDAKKVVPNGSQGPEITVGDVLAAGSAYHGNPDPDRFVKGPPAAQAEGLEDVVMPPPITKK